MACAVLGLCVTSVGEPRPAPRLPIQAELVGKLDAGHVKIGDAVFAKVTVKWAEKAISLPEGAILHGHVAGLNAYSKSNKTSEVTLVFDSAESSRNQTLPMLFTLAAVLAPDDSDASEYQPLTSAVGVVLQATTPSGSPGSMTRSLSASAETVYHSPARDTSPLSIAAGQVLGIRGLKLSVGAGPDGGSVLYTSGRNVRLESGTRLAFVPSETAPVSSAENGNPVATGATAPTPSADSAAVADNVEDQTEVCVPPECSIALPVDEAETKANALSTISLRELGYVPPPTRELHGFDYDSAIAYLGPQELLFTFNPHVLVRRSKAEVGLPKLHVIRAIVMDAATLKVQRSVDWKIHDANQYLWPAGPDRVLVHVGSELRIYGPHLKQLQALPLDGPLTFVTISPSKTYFAVGTLQERHSETVHRALVEAEGREPEEDVEVRVVDSEFHVLATILRTTKSPPPVLSDKGEIGADFLGHARWRISEHTWDGQKRVLARVSSTCRLQMTTLLPNLLFVVGCDRQSDGRWYRMLRSDGKPVLKGWSPSAELEQSVIGSAGGDLYAVSIVRATKSLARGSVFQSDDLQSEQISVYQVKNGRRLFTFRIADPSPIKQTFVLAPHGEQLAVLAGDQVSIYAMPGMSAKVSDVQ
jgi:hypothetical protein